MTTDHGATARAVAAAALAVPGVARLTGGHGAVMAATHYPRGTVAGVRLTSEKVWVHIVISHLPLGPVAEEVRSAVRVVLDDLADKRAVEVVVEDLDESALRTMLAARHAVRGRVA